MASQKVEKVAEGANRKAWTRPVVTSIRAGSAENRPGTTIFDGIVEGIGS